MKPITNSETVEIVLTQGQAKYKLPTVTNFRNAKIKAIDVLRVGDVTKSPLGAALCNETALKSAHMIYNVNGIEALKSHPLATMNAGYLNGRLFEVGDLVMNLDKTEISFSNAGAIVTGEALCIVFYW